MHTAQAWLLVAVALSGCAGQAHPIDGQADGEAGSLARLAHEPGVHPFVLMVGEEAASGYVGVPVGGTASTLVVLAKAFGEAAKDWVPLMQELAGQGHLAVAMEYRGSTAPWPDPAWKVAAGAQDTLAATLALQALHPEVDRTVLYGVSMGGEVSGLAVAHAPPGTFTYWLEGAGVMDLASEWAELPLFRPMIEAEAGGRPDQVPVAYQGRSPVHTVPSIARQGLTRVYLVHGQGDVVVPAEQGERMYQALRRAGVPVTYYGIVAEPNAPACAPLVLACAPVLLPAGPANHDAGWSAAMRRILHDRIDGRPDTTAPAVRVLFDAVSGTEITVPET
jgi:pimeloyl-ACP methyl ester carboxylesterase